MPRNRFALLMGSLCLLLACQEPGQKQPPSSSNQPLDAAAIVQRSIDRHGGNAMDSAWIAFAFREHQYVGTWNRGQYQFERRFEETGQQVRDILTKDGFRRMRAGEAVAVPDSMVPRYSASVNSVWYFAMLPFRLQDPAVQLQDLGLGRIQDQPYHKIQVTFAQEGGGEDFEDVFVYWFHPETYLLDYLAYSYAEEDGLGLRFREAYHRRERGGILFQDYVNYRADPTRWTVQQLDSAFTLGQLDTLSLIELEQIQVGDSLRE